MCMPSPQVEECAACHGEPPFEEIRISAPDYDGDGDTTEGVKAELDALAEALYAEIQTYTEAQGTKAVYNASAYPYWFDEAGERFGCLRCQIAQGCLQLPVLPERPGCLHAQRQVRCSIPDRLDRGSGRQRGRLRSPVRLAAWGMK